MKKCIVCSNNLKRGKFFCSRDCYYQYKKGKKLGGEFGVGHKPLRPFKKGHKAWNKGKHFVHSKSFKKGQKPPKVTVEARKRRGEKMKGELNYFWQGGITTPERIRYLGTQYRVRKLNAEGSFTQQEWEDLKQKFNYTCLCCKKSEPKVTLSVDHILPLTKGGTDYIDNIQPLCRRCNSIKNAKHIDYRYEIHN